MDNESRNVLRKACFQTAAVSLAACGVYFLHENSEFARQIGSVLQDVTDYNRRAADCRRTMVHVNELKFGYSALNPLVVFSLCLNCADNIFRNPVIAIAILVVYASVLAYFMLGKGNIVIATAAAALLPLLDWRFLIMLAADVVLTFFYERLRRPLAAQPGYPEFFGINVHYENTKAPSEK